MFRKFETLQDIRDKETQSIKEIVLERAKSSGHALNNNDIAYLLFVISEGGVNLHSYYVKTSVAIYYDGYMRDRENYINTSGYTRAQIEGMKQDEYVTAINASQKRWEYNHRPCHS